MNRLPYIAIAGLGLAGGIWLSGCTRSTVPPSGSIGSPMRPFPPDLTRSLPPVTKTPPSIGSSNPWKPTVPARAWKYVVIHHTASKGGSVESINAEHLQRKDGSGNNWLGIGYHFLIGNGNGMGDGEIEPTFRWRTQIQGAHAGAQNKDYNEHGIGVCLVGNFDQQHPSEAQRLAVKKLVQTLKTEYRISASNIVGHRDIKATACPGKLFPMSEIAGADGPLSETELSAIPPFERVAASPGSVFR